MFAFFICHGFFFVRHGRVVYPSRPRCLSVAAALQKGVVSAPPFSLQRRRVHSWWRLPGLSPANLLLLRLLHRCWCSNSNCRRFLLHPVLLRRVSCRGLGHCLPNFVAVLARWSLASTASRSLPLPPACSLSRSLPDMPWTPAAPWVAAWLSKRRGFGAQDLSNLYFRKLHNSFVRLHHIYIYIYIFYFHGAKTREA